VNERTERAEHVYGPVPSRRLGLSLGVDLIPFKTCTYDCVYCQLGRTSKKCVTRKEFVDSEAVIDNIQRVLSLKQRIDYITFSGSGEPTLNSGIGYLIREVKELTTIPVAVITNSSLLNARDVQDALMEADLLVPSLDAGREATFRMINRPHDAVQYSSMVEGLVRFSNAFRGKLWLEIMLVRGINDSDEEIDALSSRLQKMRIDKIQLNTVFRPPAERTVKAVKPARLQEISGMLGAIAEIVTDFRGIMQDTVVENDGKRILELIRRRPVSVSDIVVALGIHRNGVLKHVTMLARRGKIKEVQFEDRTYYEANEG
jgi:wyosine [tRNA(Phe)-imidazoG37] synthetase (radical SAM superfamily)